MHVTIDPALAALVPSDTVLLAGARVDHLRETAFYKKHLAARTSSSLEEWVEWIGVDPRRDIWEVLAMYNGVDAAVMTRGKFSEMGLEAKIRREGAARSSYKGHTLTGNEESAVMFMNPTTAVAGPPERLHAIIDRRGQGASPPAGLLEMVEAIDRSNQIWAAALGGSAWTQVPPEGNFAAAVSILRKVRYAKAGVNLREGFVFEAEAGCANARDADTLQSTIRAIIGLARLGARDRPALQALYDSILVRRQEAVVEVHASVPSGLLDQLLAER